MRLFSVVVATVVLFGRAHALAEGDSRLVGRSGFSFCGLGECISCGTYELGGEMLYMRPTRSDLAVAIVDPRPYSRVLPNVLPESTEQTPPQGVVQKLDPNYRFGFRISAGCLLQGCVDFMGEYTWFHSISRLRLRPNPGTGGLWVGDFTDTDAVTSPFGSAPIFTQQVIFNSTNNPAFPGEINAIVDAKVRFDYDAADLQLGYRFCKGIFGLRTFVGLHYANLDLFFQKIVQGTLHPGLPPSVTIPIYSSALHAGYFQHSQSWGIGPKIGITGRCCLLWGFGIGGRFGLSLLAGRRHSKVNWYYQTYGATATSTAPVGAPILNYVLDTPANFEALVAPELDARLGINYLWRCGRWGVFAEVGYEIISYINFVYKGAIYRQDRGYLGDQSNSFNLNGLYLRIQARF